MKKPLLIALVTVFCLNTSDAAWATPPVIDSTEGRYNALESLAQMEAQSRQSTLEAAPKSPQAQSPSKPGLLQRLRNLFTRSTTPQAASPLREPLLRHDGTVELQSVSPASSSASDASSVHSEEASSSRGSNSDSDVEAPLSSDAPPVVVIERNAHACSSAPASTAHLNASDFHEVNLEELSEPDAELMKHLAETLFPKIPTRKLTILASVGYLVVAALASAGDGMIYNIATGGFLSSFVSAEQQIPFLEGGKSFFVGAFASHLLPNAAVLQSGAQQSARGIKAWRTQSEHPLYKNNRPLLRKIALGTIAASAVAASAKKLQLLYSSCGGEFLPQARIGLPIFSIAVVPIALVSAISSFATVNAAVQSGIAARSQGATPEAVNARKLLLNQVRLALRTLHQMTPAQLHDVLENTPALNEVLSTRGTTLSQNPQAMRAFLAGIWQLNAGKSFDELPEPTLRKVMAYTGMAVMAATNVATAWVIAESAVSQLVGSGAASYCLATVATPVLAASHAIGAYCLGRNLYDQATGYDDLAQCCVRDFDDRTQQPSCSKRCLKTAKKVLTSLGHGAVALWHALPAFAQGTEALNGGLHSLNHVQPLSWAGASAFAAGEATANATVLQDGIEAVKTTATNLRQPQLGDRAKYELLTKLLKQLHQELKALSDESIGSLSISKH